MPTGNEDDPTFDFLRDLEAEPVRSDPALDAMLRAETGEELRDDLDSGLDARDALQDVPGLVPVQREALARLPVGSDTAAYLRRFQETALTRHADWTRSLERHVGQDTFRRLHRTKSVLKRLWTAWLTLLPADYDDEVALLAMPGPALCQEISSLCGIRPAISVRTPHGALVVRKAAELGRLATIDWVRQQLVPVLNFGVDGVYRACTGTLISQAEARKAAESARRAMTTDDASVRAIVDSIIRPDFTQAAAGLRSLNPYKLRLRAAPDGELELCRWCGSAKLECEPTDSKWCCDEGRLTQFQLQPLPAVLRRALETDMEHARNTIGSFSRYINNHFALATLYTSGYNRARGVDLNANSANSAFKIEGRAYLFVHSGLRNQYETYVRDGLAPLPGRMPASLTEFLREVRDMLRRENPIASAFVQVATPAAEDHVIVICSHNSEPAPRAGPREVSVIIVPPDQAVRHQRQFAIEITPEQRRGTASSRNLRRMYLNVLDSRCDPLHYPVLHCKGELGWGPSTKTYGFLSADGSFQPTGGTASRVAYLRYRALSADFCSYLGTARPPQPLLCKRKRAAWAGDGVGVEESEGEDEEVPCTAAVLPDDEEAPSMVDAQSLEDAVPRDVDLTAVFSTAIDAGPSATSWRACGSDASHQDVAQNVDPPCYAGAEATDSVSGEEVASHALTAGNEGQAGHAGREARVGVVASDGSELAGPHRREHLHQDSTELMPYRVRSANGRRFIPINCFQLFSRVGQEYAVDGWSRCLDDWLLFESGRGVNKTEGAKRLSASFFGSWRFLREKARDGMAVVRRKGLPLLFITITCNKAWAEFGDVLAPGQDPLDSPAWVDRIFKAKIDAFVRNLKKGLVFLNMRDGDKVQFSLRGGDGHAGFHVMSVEFQMRGMPHVHMLFRPHNAAKFEAMMAAGDYSWVDKIISARLPRDGEYEFLREFGMIDETNRVADELVAVDTRYAGPDGHIALLKDIRDRVTDMMLHNCTPEYCCKNGPCRFCYPQPLRDTTGVSPCGRFILYKRLTQDDVRVVPYSPWILIMLNCHANVALCHNRGSIGYLYKYINKPADSAKFGFATVNSTTGEPTEVDELTEFREGRVLSATECLWRTMDYDMYTQTPTVASLQVHDEDRSCKHWGLSDLEKYLARPMDTPEERSEFEGLLYVHFHERYLVASAPWKDGRRMWTRQDRQLYFARRREQDECIARLKDVPVTAPEMFALLLLLQKLPCPRLDSQGCARESPRNYLLEGETFMGAAIRLGVVKEGTEAQHVFEHARDLRTPTELLWLLAHLTLNGHYVLGIIHNEEGHPHPENIDALAGGLTELRTIQQRYQYVLRQLWKKAESAGVDLESAHGIPRPESDTGPEDDDTVVRAERYSWNADRCAALAENALGRVEPDSEQAEIVEEALLHLQHGRGCKWIFLKGAAGTGKSYIMNLIVNWIRGRAGVACVSALTWLAASNFERGVSLHNLLGVRPRERFEKIECKPAERRLKILRAALVIVVDELPFAPKALYDIVFDFLQKIAEHSPDKQLLVLTAGDFRQLTPVLKDGGSESIVLANSLLSSQQWRAVRVFELTQQRRMLDQTWHETVEQIGEGRARPGLSLTPLCQGYMERMEALYDLSSILVQHRHGLMQSTLETIPTHTFTSDVGSVISFVSQGPVADGVIMTTTNERRRKWNTIMQETNAENHTVLLPAYHEIRSGDEGLTLNSDMDEFECDGVPSADLRLKVGDVCMVTGCVHGLDGLCNNARVRVVEIHDWRKLVTVQKLNPDGSDTRQFFDVPRRWYRDLQFCGSKFARLQFPLELAYAITVHKAQGQTLSRVVFDATLPVFAHGHLYVALSRVRERNSILFFKDDPELDGQPVQLNNVVYHPLLAASRERRGGQHGEDSFPAPARRNRQTVRATTDQRVRRRAPRYARTS